MKAVRGETYGIGSDAVFAAVRAPLLDIEHRIVKSGNLGSFRVKKGRGQRKNRQSKGVKHLRFGPVVWFNSKPSLQRTNFDHLALLAGRFVDSLTPHEREVLAKRFGMNGLIKSPLGR